MPNSRDHCFWCEDDNNAAFISGHVTDYRPCLSCRGKMETADVLVIEIASAGILNRYDIFPGVAPTSRWTTITIDYFKKISEDLNLGQPQILPILANRRMFVERDIYERINQWR